MMKRLALIFFMMAGMAAGSHAQTVVRGVVFDDTNLNSRLDAGEKGVRGVGVSNGVDVVLTDRDGGYELPASAPMIVFVIKPSGYRIPVDERQIPQFYYIHKPAGSPELNYPGSAPTGALPEQVNFPLVKYKEPENFNVVAFGDTQTHNEKEIDYLRRSTVVNMVGMPDVAFGTTLGDIAGDRPDLFEPVSRLISKIGVPWHHIIGNHDHNHDAADDSIASESYEAHFGPATYSFNYGKVHFIVADNIIQAQGGSYHGGFREEQIRFIENDLKMVPADHLVVFMAHIHFQGIKREDRDRLFAAMSRFPNTLSLSAHTHLIRQNFFGESEGWTGRNPHLHLNAGAICANWWSGITDQYNLPGTMMHDGSPQGYFMLRFTGNQYVYDYKTVHYDAPQQISVFCKDRTLYANFFAGNEFSRLRYRLDGGAWQPMEQALEPDPLYSSIYKRWEEEKGLPGRKPSSPEQIVYHLWKAAVDIPHPESVFEVEATDMFGRTFTQHLLVE